MEPIANPPVSAAALIKKHFNFWRQSLEGGACSRPALISKLNERSTNLKQNILYTFLVIKFYQAKMGIFTFLHPCTEV